MDTTTDPQLANFLKQLQLEAQRQKISEQVMFSTSASTPVKFFFVIRSRIEYTKWII